ncbi:hypothetical protein OUZ56_014560 [Daphnia magna]|uniref:Uncharacterized protein n=1 Tax=Daphnia magna TaxID=35525 RepID=A0ABR0AKB7_9CRUS|nr:hypothetical protein OUZ56_014560 [Daphnia magna]
MRKLLPVPHHHPPPPPPTRAFSIHGLSEADMPDGPIGRIAANTMPTPTWPFLIFFLSLSSSSAPSPLNDHYTRIENPKAILEELESFAIQVNKSSGSFVSPIASTIIQTSRRKEVTTSEFPTSLRLQDFEDEQEVVELTLQV